MSVPSQPFSYIPQGPRCSHTPHGHPPSHQARWRSCSSIGAPARAHLPQRHRLHLHHVLHARARGRCKKTPLIQKKSHSLLIVSAGKTPPTCDEIVDLRPSACGHDEPGGEPSRERALGQRSILRSTLTPLLGSPSIILAKNSLKLPPPGLPAPLAAAA